MFGGFSSFAGELLLRLVSGGEVSPFHQTGPVPADRIATRQVSRGKDKVFWGEMDSCDCEKELIETELMTLLSPDVGPTYIPWSVRG